MIKQGEVVFVKTTGEAVFVLRFGPDDPDLVTVRRPVAGQDGIRHEKSQFFSEELESLEDQRKRFMAEREEIVKKYGPKTDELSSLTPDPRFSEN